MWHNTHPNSLNDVPRSFLSNFEDISYHNDTMPRFEIMGNDWLESENIRLWIDYGIVEKRDDTERVNGRFCITVGHESDFETDDLAELIEYLESNIDRLRIETLISIAVGQANQLNAEIGYAHTTEFSDVLAWFKQEIFKFGLAIPPTTHTYELDYMIAARELERAAVFNAADIVNYTPTPDNFNMFEGKLQELFGDNTEVVKELMAKHASAPMVDFLWLDRK